jgi:hypothetical protein
MEIGLPIANAIGAAGLAAIVYRSHRQLWRDERRVDPGA